MSWSVCIARYDEDLTWAWPFAPNVTVYNKGPHPVDLLPSKTIPNLGREAYAYLRYIIDNYDNLCDTIIFVQAGLCAHADVFADSILMEAAIISRLRTETQNCGHSCNAAVYDIGFYSAHPRFRPSLYHSHVHAAEQSFGDWFKKYVDELLPDHRQLKWFKNAVFGVSKAHIQSRSRAYYEELLLQFASSAEHDVDHYFERAWFYIFNLQSLRHPAVSQHDENVLSTEDKNWYKSITNQDLLDGREYHILEAAAKAVKGVPGISCEIGVRRGGSSCLIMQQFLDTGDKRLHIGIDPYGNLPYTDYEGVQTIYNYTDVMRREAHSFLHDWCRRNDFDFQLFVLEDSEFFRRYSDGVPWYDGTKILANTYAFVFFDGQHCVASVKNEIEFFSPRTPVGGIWVFDDIDHYPHMAALDGVITALGFSQFRRGVAKIAYCKTHLATGPCVATTE